MRVASLFALFALTLAVASAQHAHCTLDVALQGDCSTWFSYIESQLKDFSNPNVRESNYTFVSADPPSQITGLLTTPVHKYVDNLTFTFSSDGDNCALVATSVSEPVSIYDYDCNFCGCWNLLRTKNVDYEVKDCLFHPEKGHESDMCNKY